MEERKICLTKTKKRNNKKHEQSMKHKYFSNLVMNKYTVKDNQFF